MPTFALLPLLLVLGGTARGAQWDINDLVDSLGCKDFSGALESTGLMYVLGDNNSGPFTVFAPTDAAFNNLPANIAKIFNFGNWELMHDIVTFHITYGNLSLGDLHNEALLPSWQGQEVRVNVYTNSSGGASRVTAEGATIVQSAVATNGIVHVVDRVLYNVPRVTADTYVHEQRQLTTLDLLVSIGSLQDTLMENNLTLIAPEDSVFKKIPGFLNKTLVNETIITNLVQSHVVKGTIYSVGLINGAVITNMRGQQITVKVDGTNITLNGAPVIHSDVSVTNGVIHTVGGLLFPV